MTAHALTTEHRQLIVDTATGIPELRWFGRPLSRDLVAISRLHERPIANNTLDAETAATLLPVESGGWVGQPGIEGHRLDGSGWSPRFELVECSIDQGSTSTLVCVGADPSAGLRVATTLRLHPEGVVTVDVALRNDGTTNYVLNRMSVTIPVGPEITELQVPEGRWIHEFHEVRVPWRVGAIEITNRRGRTSHDKPPWIFAGQASFTNQTGRVWGAHLGWSGNASVRAEVLTDGRRVLQLGEVLLGDELRLAPGESYASPTVYLAWSEEGINGVSQSFHRHLRARPQHPTTPRPVHLNTWEAVYFNHDLDTLKALADRAAELGAERYVLDDGWFHSRRDDTAGLGDWWVDADVWPNGLTPMIDHVTSLGMEFGIWVEPEMVNPDSDVYRAHPEWALHVPGYEPMTGRNQLVLDLTRDDAFVYILDHLDRLLTDHDIGYVKWDMNRDLTQPASGDRAAAHAQTLAVYRLLDELRRRHPNVEIESCSSGGGRADYGILQRTDRVWTSDSNDALDRQRIQSGFLRFFPPEVMGAHIGPPLSHTSGRQHRLGFRATTAIFGHLGIEWNLLDAEENDLAQLTEAVRFHKQHRDLLHSGTIWQVDTVDPALLIIGVVASDQSSALFSIAQLAIARNATPERLRIPGLDQHASYDISLIALADSALGTATHQPVWVEHGVTDVAGDVLESFGLQLPVMIPESAVLVHLQRR